MLRYGQLNAFDKAMIKLLKPRRMLALPAVNRWLHQEDKIIIYTKGDTVFIFNFHPTKSFDGYFVPVGKEGTYKVALSSDDKKFGGFARVDTSVEYETVTTPAGWIGFHCYLPSRSAIVLKKKRKTK